MNKELNKKLAEWAGFKEKGTGYVWPDRRFDKVPDFTESLDACFRWLVPKLHQVTIIQEFNSEAYADVVIQPEYEYLHYKEWAETPALALCLAIEQLIDKEK